MTRPLPYLDVVGPLSPSTKGLLDDDFHALAAWAAANARPTPSDTGSMRNNPRGNQ